MSGFDEGEFTYDEYDDMVRDVRNYASNLDLASPPAADGVVGIRLCVTFYSKFVQQLPVILVSTLPVQCLPSIRLLGIIPLLRLGE